MDDYETWNEGGVVPTLNLGDNTGDTRATVLILIEEGNPVIMRNREGCAGGGKGPMFSERSFTLATSNDQIVFYGNRVDDIRIQAVVESSVVRRLTPMECERLQGFPDSWTKFDAEGNEVTDGHRYKQMGNAVAVPVVSWIVNRLMGAANDLD